MCFTTHSETYMYIYIYIRIQMKCRANKKKNTSYNFWLRDNLKKMIWFNNWANNIFKNGLSLKVNWFKRNWLIPSLYSILPTQTTIKFISMRSYWLSLYSIDLVFFFFVISQCCPMSNEVPIQKSYCEKSVLKRVKVSVHWHWSVYGDGDLSFRISI